MSQFKEEFITECRGKLLTMKADLLNRVKVARLEIVANDKGSGDEADQSVAHLNEEAVLINTDRLRSQLMEIEFALARIANGEYGICEETQEPIEEQRLRAIPYTRLSIEGAEIRESHVRRFAR